MGNIDTRLFSGCLFKLRAAALSLGLLTLFAPLGRATDALHYTKNYFVTGDFVTGGVALRGTGDATGFATGTINISGVPAGGDVVAAFLYWETVEATPLPSAVDGFFDGHAIVGAVRGDPLNPACASSGGAAGPAGTSGRVYRADVLRYLPVDAANHVRLANGPHVVRMKDSGLGAAGTPPLTAGASLVVVYRLPYFGGSPFRAVVIYDGAYTMTNAGAGMTQTIGGFYQASASAAARMTQIVANGQAGFVETLSVNGTTLSTSPFRGYVGARWDNATFPITLAPNSSSFDTQVTSSDPNACVTWSAIVTSTNVTDTDFDGLLDVWESSGLHLNTGDSTHPATFGRCADFAAEPCVNLPAMGANPSTKDIFLEIDWLHGLASAAGPEHFHQPKLAALSSIAAAFASHAIQVHFDVGDNYQVPASPYIVPAAYSGGGEIIEESTLLCPNAIETVCAYSEPYAVLSWKVGFRAVKDGFPALGISPHFARNRKDIFHYALFAHALAGPFDPVTGLPLAPHPASVSGVADRAADILMTLGLWRSDIPADDQIGSALVQAGTLMHELGHNLNLSHAGVFRTPNCEPNYPSVMNYLYQTRGLTDASGLPHIDFSFGVLNPLNENFLSETAPMGPMNYRVRYYGPALVGGHATAHCDGSPITDGALSVRLETPGLSTPDWNGNGLVDADVPLDVNFNGSFGDGVFGSNIFLDSNDWANLNLQQIGARLNVSGLSGDVGQSDLGQSDLGQSDLGQSDLGQSDLGQSDLGQSDLGQSDLGQSDLGDVTYEAAETSSPSAVDPAHPLTVTLSGPAGGPTGLALGWGAPIGMAQIRSYNIYRTVGAGVLPSLLATIPASAPPVTLHAYTDTVDGTTTLYNTNYTYYVTSVDVNGTESGLSNAASGIVLHLFIKANDKSREYGNANSTLTFDFATTGLDPGVSGTTTCATAALQASNVGNYPITCSGLTPPSGVTYTAGNLNITSAPLTITVAANTKPYDGGVTALTAPTVSGLKLAKDTVTGLAETYNNKNAGTNKLLSVSAYTVNDGNSGLNYAVTTVSNTIGIINKVNATIAVQPYNVIQDGNPHTATGTATGVEGESLSGLNLANTTHTNVGSYNTDFWFFTDSTGNYNNIANTTITDVITPANFWPNGYAYRGKITVQAGKVPNTDQTNFPVLISGIFPDLATTANGGRISNTNGYDIIFTSDPNGFVPLSYERESYSGTNGQAVFWVRVPVLSHTTNTVIYAFYGNLAVTTDQSNRIATWDSSFRGVWHLDDNAANTTVAGATGLNAVNAANTSGKTVPGQIVAALNYGGTDKTTTTLNRTGAFTWEAWFKATALTSTQSLLTIDGANYVLMDVTSNGLASFWSADGLTGNALGVTGLSPGAWYHLVLTRSGDSVPNGYIAYLNGGQKSRANTGVLNNGNTITLGYRPDFPSQGFRGALDEIRVSNIARSADWIATEYNNYLPGFYSIDWSQIGGAGPAATATTLTTTAPEPVPFGQSVPLSALVTGTATGVVTFLDGTTELGISPLSGGLATFTATGLAAGPHNFTAVYGGDAENLPSTSNAVSRTVSAPVVNASWPNGYRYRGTITVPPGKVPNTDQIDFPVLISGIYPDLATTANGGKVTNANGYDIIFTSGADGSGPLNYERASYSGINGQAVFWVRAPVLSHTLSTVIYVFYGNSTVTTDQSNKNGTWDTSYRGVWHLDDNAANTTVAGSTGVNATNAANTSSKAAAGKVVGALTYNGSTDKTLTSLNRTPALTWDVWFKAAAFSSSYNSLITIDGANYLLMGVSAGGAASFWAADGVSANSLGITGLVPGTWYHLVLTRSGDNVANGYTAYLNGVLKGRANTGVLSNGNSTTFGYRPDLPSQAFNGALDEIRISNIARSADQVATEYNNYLPGFYSAGWGQTP